MNKIRITLNSLFFIVILIPVVYATNFDFYRDDGTAGTTFDVGYEGDTKNMQNNVVHNKNLACSIKCSYATNQGKSGIVPGVTGGIIPALSTSPRFSIPVIAQGSTVTTTMTCIDSDESWPCDGSKTLSKDVSIAYNYCGDGDINSGEECESSNLNGKTCKSVKGSDYDGTLRCSNCKFDTSRCFKLGTDENCAFVGNNCASNEECVNKQCRLKCGNGKKDPGENCRTCYQDVSCEDGQGACSNNGVCIDLDSEDNCGAIGNRCDTSEKVTSTSQKSCSNDYTKAIGVLKITKEKCQYKKCTQIETTKNKETNCRLQNTYCQDGTCGCSEGYAVCEPLHKCVRKKEIKLNQPCSCDFQCENGLCDEGRCKKGLISAITSEKTSFNIGEESEIFLSVSNPLKNDVYADLLVSVGSGLSITSKTESAQCKGNQCKSDKIKIPANGKKSISFNVEGVSASETKLIASVTYEYAGKINTIEEIQKVIITDINKITGAAILPNISANYIGIGVVVLIIIIGLIIYFIGKSHRNKSGRKEHSKEDYEDLIKPIKILLKHDKKKKEFEHKFLDKGWTNKQINKAMKEAKKELKEEVKHEKKKGEYCVECGKKIEHHHKHCPHCGTKQ